MDKEEKNLLTNTPYDDVFRTMVNDCRELLLPLINEVFGEHYTGKERIIFSPNEHFLNQENGNEQRRITDTTFLVERLDGISKRYHWECQASSDHTILLRLFEYDSQIALDEKEELTEGLLCVSFPHTAILYLRSTPDTEDYMIIRIVTPGGTASYQIPVVKMQAYSLEEIFRKNLLFLLPFYIFNREKELPECNTDTEKRERLKAEFLYIRRELENLREKKKITEYQKRAIIEMTAKVIANLSSRYERVSKEVGGVMVGKTLEYEAKTILQEGIEQGEKKGIKQRNISLITKKVQRGKTLPQIADEMETTESDIRDLYDAVIQSGPEYKSEDIIAALHD